MKGRCAKRCARAAIGTLTVLAIVSLASAWCAAGETSGKVLKLDPVRSPVLPKFPETPEKVVFPFDLVRSPALAKFPDCVPEAHGVASIEPGGPVEILRVEVEGLPPNTNFDFFVIQVPNAPFGMSWYQGDIDTDDEGEGHGKFIGRFSIETFVVAPGSAPAPLTFNNAFPSVSPNPPTGPIQMYHLGLWFNSPDDAKNAGCPSTVTPFNGEHDAGVQALNTSNFPDLEGPLINIHP
jgi:hypothetical protein